MATGPFTDVAMKPSAKCLEPAAASGIVACRWVVIFKMKDEMSGLPERAIACRTKAGDLLARAHSVTSPEIADELVAIALQWLVLAKRLESKRDAPHQD
jgi:hypothetical protein